MHRDFKIIIHKLKIDIMKKLIRQSGIILVVLCFTSAAYGMIDREELVPYEKLPKQIKDFVSTHFPDNKVAYAEKDWDGYDVILDDGTDLEFTTKGQWTEIQMRHGEMPESVLKLLPATLLNYLKQNYPEKKIKEIVNKPYGYEIELFQMHDLELKFDKNGKFLYIDD